MIDREKNRKTKTREQKKSKEKKSKEALATTAAAAARSHDGIHDPLHHILAVSTLDVIPHVVFPCGPVSTNGADQVLFPPVLGFRVPVSVLFRREEGITCRFGARKWLEVAFLVLPEIA